MAGNRKMWVYAPSKLPKAAVPASVKMAMESKAKELIETILKPRHVKPPPKKPKFNYITDISTRWHSGYFYFVSTYACPGPNALSPTFETNFARMKHLGGGRFSLAFMRHTGQWVPLDTGMSVERCLASIRDDPWFVP